MGQVWAVTHEVTLRTAALKFLNGPVHQRADRRRRFLREARAASAVQHPNVVQIHDFFELEDGTPVMIMDLLEGETLAQRFKRERALSLTNAVDLLLPVISAVGTAHALGIVHRDLKPDNVFVTAAGGGAQVRVLDFGIAKLTASSAEDTDGALTAAGAVMGTPRYMAPEQTVGDGNMDHRADIWSIGVMLYEALAGARPIDGENVCRILQRLMNEGITPLRVLEPDLPEPVLALVDRMLRRDPRTRPNDLREVHDILAPHGTVTVPAFEAAIAERELAPPSSALSAPRPVPDPVLVEEADTLLDVSPGRLDPPRLATRPLPPPEEAPSAPGENVDFTAAHALSARKARNRRWSFAAGVAAMCVAALLLRHLARSAAPAVTAAEATPMAVATVAKATLAVAEPPSIAVAETAPAAVAAPEPRIEKIRVAPAVPRKERAQPALDGPTAVSPASPSPDKPAAERPRSPIGLVEEPPF
jgi:serine/threonine protein kinase